MKLITIMKQEHRACGSSYAVFAAVVGAPLGISAFAALNKPSFLKAVFICLAALCFAFLWLSRFRLVITPEAVSYSSFFAPERTIQRADIAAAGFAARTGGFESPFTFVIRSGSGSEIRINAKVFSRATVSELCTLQKT